MSDFNLALTESRSLRSEKLSDLSNEKAIGALNKAKALVMAVWKGENIATTAAVAEFYEVPEDTIQTLVKNHRDELKSDGLRVVRGKDLREVVSKLDTTYYAPSLSLWSPRAALRAGMLLRDSAVARSVRDVVLNLTEQVPVLSENLEIARLENENLRMQLEIMNRSEAIASIHGVGMLALIKGVPDAVVHVREVVTESVICKDGRTVSFVGKSSAELGKELGFKTGRDFERWLERMGRGDLISQGMRAVQAPYVAEEHIAEVKRLWSQKRNAAGRQLLLGE